MIREGQSIIDMLFQLLQQLLIPNWTDLIALLPWVLVVIVAAWLVFTAMQWQRAGGRNRSRVPRPAPGSPPPGVHMPGPSRWPFVVPIGLALLLASVVLVARDAQHNPTQLLNPPIFVIGLVVTLVAIVGWLREAMREWRSTAAGGHESALAVALPAGTYGLAPTTRMAPTTSMAPTAAMASNTALVPVSTQAVVAYPEPPAGVHMPGPSPWPFFAPIALAVILLGLVFSAILLVAGIVLGVIAAAGWLMDAGQEYHSTEAVGHAVPRTRDPNAVWPRRLVPLYGAVILIGFLGMLAPTGLAFLNSFKPAAATPSAIAVPAVPEISASSAVSFDTKTLIVPAGRPFDLTFDNKNAGVPHNVRIADSAAQTTILFDGDVVTGPASQTYHVPALQPGTYYFECKIHPNMNGTVQALPETGGPAPSGAAPSGAAGGSPTP